MGNDFYTYKVLGSETEPMDRAIFGFGITGLYLVILISPILFFSEYGGFITKNPVHGANLKVSFLIERTMSGSELDLDPENFDGG